MLTVVVLVMSVFLVISLLFWLCSPGWRQRIEEPKYRSLGQQQPESKKRQEAKRRHNERDD